MSDKRNQEGADKRGEDSGEWIEKRGRNVPPPPPELTTQDTGDSQAAGSGQDSSSTSQQSESGSESD
ncbi:MAG: hypothetical protein OXL96_12440 [Candidatus Poribacteria bacterium]|nr:hypothetical protein [Candidatus Poribacteria bacterium]